MHRLEIERGILPSISQRGETDSRGKPRRYDEKRLISVAASVGKNGVRKRARGLYRQIIALCE